MEEKRVNLKSSCRKESATDALSRAPSSDKGKEIPPETTVFPSDFSPPLGYIIPHDSHVANAIVLPSNQLYRIWQYLKHLLVVCASFIWPAFAKKHDLPQDLQKKVISQLGIKQRTDVEGLEMLQLLESLPKSLQCKIKRHIFKPILENVYLFRNAGFGFINHVASVLDVEYYENNENVILKDDEPTAMYVLVSGTMMITKMENGVSKDEIVETGGICGEIGVLCHRPQPFTVRTRSMCQILRICRKKFLDIYRGNIKSGANIMRDLFQHMKTQNLMNIVNETENILGYGLDGLLTLHYAVMEKKKTLLIQLLRSGVDPNQVDEEGNTALHIAVKNEDVGSVKCLLRRKADCNRKDQSGKSPIWMSMEKKNSMLIHAMLHTGEMASTDVGYFACIAVDHDCTEFLEMMARYKFVSREAASQETSALHKAVLKGNMDMVKYLIECHYSPYALDSEGESPYSLATGNDQLKMFMTEAFEKLREKQSKDKDVQIEDHCGRPCPHCTCKKRW